MPTVKFQLRRDTAANWTSVNPTLGPGEPALETDTNKVKYGDGVTAWNSLPYAVSAPSATIQASEAISAGNIVNLYTSGGAARIRKANATDISKPANAFAPAAISSGASGAIYFVGQIITGLTSLTPGTVYYLDTTGGALTATPPSSVGNGVQQVGIALSATTLLFNPQPMVEYN